MIPLILLLACPEPGPTSARTDSATTPPDSASPADPFPVEAVGESAWPPPVGPTAAELYDPLALPPLTLELPQASLDALALDPDTYVPADLTFHGETWRDVGVRLKGNSSFQPLVAKPALKIKAHAFVPHQRIGDVERLTLNNNVNEPSMMAETLAYRTYRFAGSPAPRTGYAQVTLNGVSLGVYTLVEAMDDEFVDVAWPDSRGTLYEPARGCDLDEEISCYSVDQEGADHEPDELEPVHQAALGDAFDPLWAHVDDARVLAFLAAERFTAHEDSYSYNDNNHHLFFEPDGERISLSPWGADSTFVYRHPADLAPGYPCDSELETLGKTPFGLLAWRCEADAACDEALRDAQLALADQIEAWDLADFAGQVGAVLLDAAGTERRQGHSLRQFEERVACHQEWILARPQVVRNYLE